MKRLQVILIGALVFAVLLVPLLAEIPAATALAHQGPIPFPGSMIPHPDPSNHHHIGKRTVTPAK